MPNEWSPEVNERTPLSSFISCETAEFERALILYKREAACLRGRLSNYCGRDEVR
jgi:hypothetical protein